MALIKYFGPTTDTWENGKIYDVSTVTYKDGIIRSFVTHEGRLITNDNFGPAYIRCVNPTGYFLKDKHVYEVIFQNASDYRVLGSEWMWSKDRFVPVWGGKPESPDVPAQIWELNIDGLKHTSTTKPDVEITPSGAMVVQFDDKTLFIRKWEYGKLRPVGDG